MHEELLQFYVPCLFRMEVLVLVFWYALNNRRWEVGRGAIFFLEVVILKMLDISMQWTSLDAFIVSWPGC